MGRPDGEITRGTTGINRLRRIDRWLVTDPQVARALRSATKPLVIDLGYGARPDTCIEMVQRLRTVAPELEAVGLEIDPQRVVDDRDGVHFAVGGFELAGLRPHLVRAFNVLRQYDESRVGPAWDRMRAQLQPGGLIVEGTCDELGRKCCWITLDRDGPQSLTLAWAPAHSDRPSDLAPRLPKALIHRNVPGEPIHHLLREADRAWDTAAPMASFGARARWRRTIELLRDNGFPISEPRRTTRDNVLTVPWSQVAPT